MAIEDFTGAAMAGGASGNGRATAQALHTQGAHVVLADVRAGGLSGPGELGRDSAPDSAARIATIATDVSDDTQVRGLMREALGLSGCIDLVMACGGIGRGGRIEDLRHLRCVR